MSTRLLLCLMIVSSLMLSGCLIRGRVVDEKGLGVAGVTVNLSGAASGVTTTNRWGYYQFGSFSDKLPAGDYTVTPSGNTTPASQDVTLTLRNSGVANPVNKVDFSIGPADESDIYYSDLADTSDWNDATHGKLTSDEIIANIDTVFDTTSVQKIRIVIESENWELMNRNLDDLIDELDGSNDFNSVDNPFFVPCELFYNGVEWYKVGIRFKGNSSLYNAHSNKLSFKLDFDEFEDAYPEIDNQRFYGFKQLNLKNNYSDESEMHEIVATELFREFGLVGPNCSFYELYLNVDDSGLETNDIYYGLYSVVEEVDDTVIKTQYYDNDDGNLYKPEDDAATFASGTFDTAEYDLKTDDDETYEDITELYEAINDSSRTTDLSAWQTDLEAIFDVDIFLKWLAANSVMQNWDTYGVMPQNFYLYHNPDTAKFEWIPWDNNEALIDHPRCLSLNMASVDSNWPLIKYILDVSDYKTAYKGYVADFAGDFFNGSSSVVYNVNDRYDTYEALIEDYVTKERPGYTFTSASRFSAAVSELKTHTTERYISALNYANE